MLQQTIIQFPEIRLSHRDGRKLRGYFARVFGSESDLFHNHDGSGRSIYRYPHIQYKIIQGSPTVIGIADGALLLRERFTRVDRLEIGSKTFSVEAKNLSNQQHDFSWSSCELSYHFTSPWLALNQENYRLYRALDFVQKRKRLEQILIGNIISVAKSVQFQISGPLKVIVNVTEVPVSFKGRKMIGFKGTFSTNIALPNLIGLGKSVSRGFGTIVSNKNR